MKRTALYIAAFILASAPMGVAQRLPQGPPAAGGPPRGEGPIRPGQAPPMGPARGGPHSDWFKLADTNRDQKIDQAEAAAAADATFDDMDRDHNGTIERSEIGRRQGPDENRAPRADDGRGNEMTGNRPDAGKPLLPPFFFMKRIEDGGAVTKSVFDAAVRSSFAEMDKNGDGFLTKEEARPPKGPGQGPIGPPPPPPPPNAHFIGAELRFGDKLVKGQPFSAETVVEDNRRLYDGTAVTKQSRGAIYRDTSGRTRREQPLDNVGGFAIVGDDSKPQMLVFINDFAANVQYFLDLNNKIARASGLGEGPRAPRANGDGPPPAKGDAPDEAKSESLGTRMIEGVSCEGTRTTFEIPTGQIGNAKPIQVVSEKWFSPELQVVVLSRHLDPLAGEHLFKLINIRRTEPDTDLFAVPQGFKIEPSRGPRRDEE